MEKTEVFCYHIVQVTNLCSVICIIITADKLWSQGTRSCQFHAKVSRHFLREQLPPHVYL